MRVGLFFHSETDMSGKVAAYAIYIVDEDTKEFFQWGDTFKSEVKTLTQMDCAGAVNAILYLSKYPQQIIDSIDKITVYTESGHVQEMIDTLKSYKHCDEILKMLVKLRKKFKCEIRAKKLEKKMLPGDPYGFMRTWCKNTAISILNQSKSLLS